MPNNKILIVEDELITAIFIQDCLEQQGYEVIDTIVSGEEAISLVQENKPDLVLMDIMLKGKLSGIETAKHINKNYDIPIIFLTAYSDSNSLEGAKESNPFGYLLKPIDEKNLYPMIEMALAKHKKDIEVKEQNLWVNTVIRNINDAIIATDVLGNIRFSNNEASKLFENYTTLKNINIFTLFSGDAEKEKKGFSDIISGLKKEVSFQSKFKQTNNEIDLDYAISPIIDYNEKIAGMIFNFNNTKRELITSIDTKDMLGICSFCKKIHDNNDIWSEIEQYIQKNFNIIFSHGICFECSKKYYPDFS